MSARKQKRIAARESWVDVGRFRFKIRRPTEMDLIRLRKGDQYEVTLDAIKEYVVDWQNVLEADINPGEASDPAPFDREDYEDWIEDNPHLWPAIAGEIWNRIKAERDRQEAEAKNFFAS